MKKTWAHGHKIIKHTLGIYYEADTGTEDEYIFFFIR